MSRNEKALEGLPPPSYEDESLTLARDWTDKEERAAKRKYARGREPH
jgi:FtsP/CotA-like multicopper oxidase with cupredoxin domain